MKRIFTILVLLVAYTTMGLFAQSITPDELVRAYKTLADDYEQLIKQVDENVLNFSKEKYDKLGETLKTLGLVLVSRIVNLTPSQENEIINANKRIEKIVPTLKKYESMEIGQLIDGLASIGAGVGSGYSYTKKYGFINERGVINNS